MENTNTPTDPTLTFDHAFSTFVVGLIIEKLTPTIATIVQHQIAHATLAPNNPLFVPFSNQLLSSSAFADAVQAQVDAKLESLGEDNSHITGDFERKVKKIVQDMADNEEVFNSLSYAQENEVKDICDGKIESALEDYEPSASTINRIVDSRLEEQGMGATVKDIVQAIEDDSDVRNALKFFIDETVTVGCSL